MTYVDLVGLVASAATALGVLFACFQFVAQRRDTLTAFTIERVDRFRERVAAPFYACIENHSEQDKKLSDEDFFATARKDRAPIFDGLTDIGSMLQLIDTKRVDLKLLGKLGFFSEILQALENCGEYFVRGHRIAGTENDQWSSVVETVTKLQRRYE
jgi:hypothetical protein